MPLSNHHMHLVKWALALAAAVIPIGSLLYSHWLTRQLLDEEVSKMEVWAEAMRAFTAADEHTDLNLVLKVMGGNHTIPVIVTDQHGLVIASRNLREVPSGPDSARVMQQLVSEMKAEGKCMKIDISPTATSHTSPEYIYLYYTESVMLRRLTLYPYAQLALVGVLVLAAIVALLASKRAEQNRVWVGLSRETAHQLGTPISALMAWSEVLRDTYPDDTLLPEMDKDVKRLQLIAERFSKIGSTPELEVTDLRGLLHGVTDYMRKRTSHKVRINLALPEHPLPARICPSLLEWVIENLCKNAVDAMEARGTITIKAVAHARGASILVGDTGKGIPSRKFKAVFKPGYTTKQRGWGLGLSLAKRIVEDYHHGHIYVKDSTLGQGTTFEIDFF